MTDASDLIDEPDLTVRVDDSDAEPDEVATLTRRLRTELLDFDVESVEPLTETPPDGSKAVSGLVAALGVKLGAAALPAALARIRHWVSRNGRSVEVTIRGDTLKVTGATVEQQEQLINTWLARHAPRA